MLTITLHICPPLKVSGVCVISTHSSASLSFHVAMALSRFLITQLSLIDFTSVYICKFFVQCIDFLVQNAYTMFVAGKEMILWPVPPILVSVWIPM